jgi:hypothetical protein
VLRSRREGHELSVIALELNVPGQEISPAVVEQVSFEVAHLASSQAKSISQSLAVGPNEFVFCLPGFDHAASRDFMRKVVQGLGSYWCHFGMAVYPENATDAESLFNFARQQCEQSRHDQGHSQAPAVAHERAS